MKSHPLNFLSTRTYQLWPSMSLSAMCYEGILNLEILRGNFIGSPSRKTLSLSANCTEAFAVKIRQDLLSGCFRIGPMWCLFIMPPFMTSIFHWTYLYELISSLFWNFGEWMMGPDGIRVALRISLGLRLYFTVYPSSRHNTDSVFTQGGEWLH